MHTVMANGGLRAVCGSHIVALAAKHYSMPVRVLKLIFCSGNRVIKFTMM